MSQEDGLLSFESSEADERKRNTIDSSYLFCYRWLHELNHVSTQGRL